jgi:hypothetical protein
MTEFITRFLSSEPAAGGHDAVAAKSGHGATGSTEHGADAGAHHESDFASGVLISLILSLLIGQVFKHISDAIHVPYTVIVCVFGLILGMIPGFRDLKVIQNFWYSLSP